MSGSLLSDKQLNRLVTQKTNQSDSDNNSLYIGTWTNTAPNPIVALYPETGSTVYTKLEIKENNLIFISSFNSEHSNPIVYINTEYKLNNNTIETNMSSDEYMYLIPGFPIPGISDEGLGAHKCAERKFIFTQDGNSVAYRSRASILNQAEVEIVKPLLINSGWNVHTDSAEFYQQLFKTM